MRGNDYLRIRYFLFCLLHRGGYEHADFLRKHNAFYMMGSDCFFQPYKLPADAKYIRFGNNVVVASGVDFICHDVIHTMLNHIPGHGEFNTYYGIIDIGNNVFIGANATILSNVHIGSNVIIGAGAIVNNDIPSGTIVAGVPAKEIGSVADLINRRKEYSNSPIATMKADERIRALWQEDV